MFFYLGLLWGRLETGLMYLTQIRKTAQGKVQQAEGRQMQEPPCLGILGSFNLLDHTGGLH
jgi:hypothetical protein